MPVQAPSFSWKANSTYLEDKSGVATFEVDANRRFMLPCSSFDSAFALQQLMEDMYNRGLKDGKVYVAESVKSFLHGLP